MNDSDEPAMPMNYPVRQPSDRETIRAYATVIKDLQVEKLAMQGGLAKLRAMNNRLVEMLRRVVPVCPGCGHERLDEPRAEHAKDCELIALLKEATE